MGNSERVFTVCLWSNRISLKQWIFWVTFWAAQRRHSAKNLRRKRLVSPSYRKKWGGIVNGLSKDRRWQFCISEAFWLHWFWLDALIPRRIPSPSFSCLSKFLVSCSSSLSVSSVHCVPVCLLKDRWASLLAIVQTSSVQGSSVFLSPCSVLAKSLTEVVASARAKLWAFLTACSPETWYFHSSSSGQTKCVLCVDTACLLI